MLTPSMSHVTCVPETVELLEQLALLDFAKSRLGCELVWLVFTLERSHPLLYMEAQEPFLFLAATWDVLFVRITRFPSRAWVPI